MRCGREKTISAFGLQRSPVPAGGRRRPARQHGARPDPLHLDSRYSPRAERPAGNLDRAVEVDQSESARLSLAGDSQRRRRTDFDARTGRPRSRHAASLERRLFRRRRDRQALACHGRKPRLRRPFRYDEFDQYICHDRIDENPWYVGYWDAPGVTPIPVPGSPPAPSTGNPSKATQAIAFSVGARQILVVAVEQFPRQGALDWAASVIASHPTFDVIFLTHSYMTMAGNLYTVNGNDYGAFAPSETYNPGFRTGVRSTSG